jgi:hypothetical protein
LLAPALLWLVLLEADYALAYNACDEQSNWFLGALAAGSLLLGAAAGFSAWRAAPPEDSDEHSAPWTIRTREIRARWMSISAIAISAWFALVMLAMMVPIVVLRPCD